MFLVIKNVLLELFMQECSYKSLKYNPKIQLFCIVTFRWCGFLGPHVGGRGRYVISASRKQTADSCNLYHKSLVEFVANKLLR